MRISYDGCCDDTCEVLSVCAVEVVGVEVGEVVSMNDVVVYRASELGGCTKALIAKRLGYTPMLPPAKFQGYFKRGDDAEEIMVALLTEKGYRITSRQLMVRIQASSGVVVDGHIDGVISDVEFEGRELGGAKVWECKRVSPSVYADLVENGWDANYWLLPRYKWQTSCYMIGTNRELRLDVVAEIDGQLKFHTLHRELPFYSELQIRTRVLGIEATVANGELPDTCDSPSYPCPFYYLPGHDPDVESGDQVVSALAVEVIKAKSDAEAAVNREKLLRRELLGAMGDKTKVRTDAATLSVQTSTRAGWDAELLMRDGVDLNKYKTKVEGSKYVRITPRKADETKEVDGDEARGNVDES